MAPPATATARRATTRAQPRPAPSVPKRPPLRIFEAAPRRKRGIRAIRRPEMWLSGILVVASLLAVVVGDAAITQGQIRLSATQHAVAAATVEQKTAQVNVAGMAAPPVVVRAAESLGLVAPTQVIDLPEVALTVPLAVPDTSPLPAGAPVSHASAASSSSPGGATATTTPANR